MMDLAVCDTCTLIQLRKGEILYCLNQLFTEVYLAKAVVAECQDAETLEKINQLNGFKVQTARHLLPVKLGPGEREAISLALELGNAVFITDDETAIKKAKQQGLLTLRTHQIIMLAKWAGIIPSAKTALDKMKAKGEGIQENIYWQVLPDTGE